MSSMGEMASVMAHDINMPLKAIIKDIKSVRQSLVDNDDKEGISELLEDAVIRGQQATSVISNLINFSSSGVERKRLPVFPQLLITVLNLPQMCSLLLQVSDSAISKSALITLIICKKSPAT